jgi:hypothetical protein
MLTSCGLLFAELDGELVSAVCVVGDERIFGDEGRSPRTVGEAEGISQ